MSIKELEQEFEELIILFSENKLLVILALMIILAFFILGILWFEFAFA